MMKNIYIYIYNSLNLDCDLGFMDFLAKHQSPGS